MLPRLPVLDHLGSGVIDFARRLGELLDVPLVTCDIDQNPKGAEFHYPKGRRDNLSSDGNDLRLRKWRPGQAILAAMGGKVAVVDVDIQNGGDADRTRQMLDGL